MRRRHALAAALCALLVFAATAQATPSVLVQAPPSAVPGGHVALVAEVREVARCSLRVGRRLRRGTVRADGRVTFRFRVARRARTPGFLRYVLRCTGVQPARGSILVRGAGGRATLRAVGPIGFDTQPAAPVAPGAEQAVVEAQAWWGAAGAAVLARFHDGQCTDWAATRRPDIVERVAVAVAAAEALGQDAPELDWTARNWARLAAFAGLTVGDTPVPGAIVVWAPGVQGADATTGHVGYVERVDGDGRFTTSEMNVGGPYVMASRTLAGAPLAGRRFIWP